MLETCLKNRIVFDFLSYYKQKKWINIIPSLLEIAVLNLYTSFKRHIFSEEDLSLIIENLKLKYNQSLQKEKNLKPKKLVNKNKKDILEKIPKFRKNLKLNLPDYINGRRDSYRSYTKNVKNINELNIYNTNENKKIRYYNKSTEVTPIKGLINYNETDVSQGEIKIKNIFKLNTLNKQLNENNFKKLDFNNNKMIDHHNTIDHSDYINNTYQNLFNIYNNNSNQDINNSFSIEKNNHKKYIKVNKNRSNKKLVGNNHNNEKSYIIQKNNNLNYNKHKETSARVNKVNKLLKYKMINNYNTKNKNKSNLFTNFNRKQILKKDEIKNNFNLNNTNYYRDKVHSKISNTLINKEVNHIVLQNSPHKKNCDFKNLTELQRYKLSQISKNKNIGDSKNIQFANIKKNFKELNLRNLFNKERKTENISNKEIMIDINNTLDNVNDINYSKYNHILFKNCRTITNKESKNKKIINYNSFNNDVNVKKSIFLNDPSIFIKSDKTKKLLLGQKINNINANGKDYNF